MLQESSLVGIVESPVQVGNVGIRRMRGFGFPDSVIRGDREFPQATFLYIIRSTARVETYLEVPLPSTIILYSQM